jgi:hypothetical protein
MQQKIQYMSNVARMIYGTTEVVPFQFHEKQPQILRLTTPNLHPTNEDLFVGIPERLKSTPGALFAQDDTSNLRCPPAHREKTAMNGAQLSTAHCDSDDRGTCPKSIPQGLKPIVIPPLFGTTEVVP